MQEFWLIFKYFLFYIVNYNISSEEFPFPFREKKEFKIKIIKKSTKTILQSNLQIW